ISVIISEISEPHKLGPEIMEQLVNLSRVSVEQFILVRSQAFAMAVSTGGALNLLGSDMSDHVLKQMSGEKLPVIKPLDWLQVIGTAANEILTRPSQAIQRYLRSLADA